MNNPTRPEAVQEAMEEADKTASIPSEYRCADDENLITLAAYVRELEADRLIKTGQCNKLLDDYQRLEAENGRLKNDLLDALDIKEGKGPTALLMVVADRDRLKAELAEIRSKC